MMLKPTSAHPCASAHTASIVTRSDGEPKTKERVGPGEPGQNHAGFHKQTPITGGGPSAVRKILLYTLLDSLMKAPASGETNRLHRVSLTLPRDCEPVLAFPGPSGEPDLARGGWYAPASRQRKQAS